MENSLHENLYNVVNSIIFLLKGSHCFSRPGYSDFTHVACIYANLLEQNKTIA